MKRLAVMLLLFVSCAPDTAQLQVSVPPSAAPCVQTATVTPILGVAIQHFLDGDHSVEYTDAVEDALKSAGFEVHPDYTYQLPDVTSILIKGRVNAWKNYLGDTSHRVGKVDLQVVDLGSGKIALALQQPQAVLAFQAPSADTFGKQVADIISAHYCQER